MSVADSALAQAVGACVDRTAPIHIIGCLLDAERAQPQELETPATPAQTLTFAGLARSGQN
jgi:hypothetical protein